jgi:hypothetical protein
MAGVQASSGARAGAPAPPRRRLRVLRRRERPSVNQFNAVAIRVGDEADPPDLLAPARRVGRLLRLDALLGQLGEQAVEVVDGERDVVVALAEVVRLLAPDVDRQLEPVAVPGQAHVDVVGLPEVELAAALEAERLVEAHRRVDVADAHAGVDERQRHRLPAFISPIMCSA